MLDPANREALRLAISAGLQLAFKKSVLVNGKVKKVWSQAGVETRPRSRLILSCQPAQMQVRPLLQDMIRASVAKSKAALVGRDNAEIAENISRMAEQEKKRAKSAAARSLDPWLVESAASCAADWVKKNPGRRADKHSAFAVIFGKMSLRMCTCSGSEVDELCPAHVLGSISLADIIYWVSEFIFEHIPFAVPTLPMALACKMQSQSASNAGRSLKDAKDAAAAAVPAFCSFLCTDAWLNLYFTRV